MGSNRWATIHPSIITFATTDSKHSKAKVIKQQQQSIHPFMHELSEFSLQFSFPPPETNNPNCYEVAFVL